MDLLSESQLLTFFFIQKPLKITVGWLLRELVDFVKRNFFSFAGLMPGYFREPRFAHDPKLYDPSNPFRPHRY